MGGLSSFIEPGEWRFNFLVFVVRCGVFHHVSLANYCSATLSPIEDCLQQQ